MHGKREFAKIKCSICNILNETANICNILPRPADSNVLKSDSHLLKKLQ